MATSAEIAARLAEWIGPGSPSAAVVDGLIWALALDRGLEADLARAVAEARRENALDREEGEERNPNAAARALRHYE